MTTNESNLTLSWKRPWSIEEIIQSSQCWSLAADSGVCELIKSFSTNLLAEVGQLNNNIKELSVESKQTNVIIQNAFNDFCMLANNQFMENLVEDVANIPITNDNSKINNDLNSNKENSLAQIIPQVSESLKMGIQVLENQFEILDVPKPAPVESNADDSDTEERSATQIDYMVNEPIYHPKDPYENRHLPHLIGTQAFVDDDTLGIGDIDDQEDLAASSAASDSGGVDNQSRSISISSSDSESEIDIKIVSSSELKSDSFAENANESDLFEDNLAPVKTSDQPAAPTFADQFQEQLRQRLSTKIIDPNSDSDEAPQNERDNSAQDIIGNKSHSVKEPVKNAPVKKTVSPPPPKPMTNTRGIFSEDSADDEDDIFGDIATDKIKNNTYTFASSSSKPAPDKTGTLPAKSSIAHSDSDDDLFLPAPRQTGHKGKIPPSNVAANKAKDLAGNATKSASKPPVPVSLTLSDSDSDLFDGSPSLGDKSQLEKPASKNVGPIKLANEKLTKASSQLSTKAHSESEGDIFQSNAKPGSNATISQKPSSKDRVKVPLFSVSDSDSDGLFDGWNKPPVNNHNKIDSPAPLPKSEPRIPKTNVQNPKVKNPVPIGSTFHLSDSSSDEIFDFLKSPNKSNITKATGNKTEASIKVDNANSGNQKLPEDSQSELSKAPTRTVVNEGAMEDYVSNERNNNANNAEDNDQHHNDSFDNIFNEQKPTATRKDKIDDTSITEAPVKPREIATDNKRSVVAPFDPLLALPPVRGPLAHLNDSIDNDAELRGGSSQYPKATARSSLRAATQINNAGSATLESHSPPNSKTSPLEPEQISGEVPRVSQPKLPAGAMKIGGLTSESFLNEMKIRQRKSRLSFNSDSDSIFEDTNSKIVTVPVPDPVSAAVICDADELPRDQIEREAPVKIDFKQKLQNALGTKPFDAPIKQLLAKPDSPDGNEIDFDKPPEEIRQLNLLTKDRARNIPRRRPTARKADSTAPAVAAIPNDSDIPKEEPEKTKPIPQQPKSVDTNPVPAISQSDDSFNIFADLPPRPEKKSKSNKKASSTSNSKTKKPIEVNVDEINDIFAISNSKPSKKAKKTKPVSDPLSP